MASDGAVRSRRFVTMLLLGVGLLLFVVVRARLWLDDFGNPDIGGIAYTADLIRAGGLPYVDTVEFKAPGAFFVVAAIFGVFGRSMGALQLGYSLWLLAGAPAIWLATQAASSGPTKQEGPDPDPRGPALAVATYLLYAGMFDLNYSSWMMPAYAWAWAATQRGLWAVEARGRGGIAVAAGFFGVSAFLLKRQAVVLGVAMLVAWGVALRRKAPGARVWTPGLWTAGGALGLAPLALLYAVRGHGGVFFEGLFAFGKAAAYAEVGGGGVGGLPLAGKVAWQLIATYPVALGLTLVALVGWAMAGAERRATWPPMLPALVLLAVSIAAGGLGGARFFLHYLVQDLPALALLAGHPGTLAVFDELLDGRVAVSRRAGAGALSLGLAGVLAWQGLQIARGDGHRYDAMPRRLESGKTAAQAAGEHIRSRTRPEDTIFVWGWTAWRVPFWAERLNATRVHKPLGTLTEFNTNGTFFEARPIHFRSGPYADEVLEDFRAHPPAYIVHSNSYTTTFMCDSDPLLEFVALAELIRTEYTPEAQYGDLFLYVRKDRLAPDPDPGAAGVYSPP